MSKERIPILLAVIGVGWYLLVNLDKIVLFNYNIFALIPVIYLFSIFFTVMAVLAVIMYAIALIPSLRKKHKGFMIDLYEKFYTTTIIFIGASIVLQLFLYFLVYVSDFFANKLTVQHWQVIITIVFFVLIIFIIIKSGYAGDSIKWPRKKK
jgi:hypothetical protein